MKKTSPLREIKKLDVLKKNLVSLEDVLSSEAVVTARKLLATKRELHEKEAVEYVEEALHQARQAVRRWEKVKRELTPENPVL